MDAKELFIGLIIMSGITYLLRALPFIVFSSKRKTPAYILWLGDVLPFAIIGMLVVYCLKGIDFTIPAEALPELVSCAVVAIFHILFKNPLLSIGSGTALYMFIVQRLI